MEGLNSYFDLSFVKFVLFDLIGAVHFDENMPLRKKHQNEISGNEIFNTTFGWF